MAFFNTLCSLMLLLVICINFQHLIFKAQLEKIIFGKENSFQFMQKHS